MSEDAEKRLLRSKAPGGPELRQWHLLARLPVLDPFVPCQIELDWLLRKVRPVVRVGNSVLEYSRGITANHWALNPDTEENSLGISIGDSPWCLVGRSR